MRFCKPQHLANIPQHPPQAIRLLEGQFKEVGDEIQAEMALGKVLFLVYDNEPS